MLPNRDGFQEIKHLAAATHQGAMNQGIFLVRKRRGGKKAIEKRSASSSMMAGDALREIELMGRCNYRCIPALLGYDLDMTPGYASIYMDFCELGSLDSLIERFASKRKRFPESFLWSVLFDISLALCYLQSGRDAFSKAKRGQPLNRVDKKSGWEEIVHCDIKPANLFLTWRNPISQYPTVVLGDFGCSIGETSRHQAGHRMDAFTRGFAPPEAPDYSGTSDIYTLALTVHCAALLRLLPYGDSGVLRRSPLADGRAGYGPTLERLLCRMLNRNVVNRPDAFYAPYLVWRERIASKGERDSSGYAQLPKWAFD